MTSLRVCIDYDDPLVAELIQNALSRYIPDLKHTSPSEAELQWSSYESISFEKIMADPKNLCNSYIFRKALIRKHFLGNTVQNWLSKHPESVLATSVPRTHILECDYADYLDEALNESFELRDALEANGELESEERTSFILKPSMSDRGQGIRIFSTLEQLQEIFEQFEEEEASEEEEEPKEDTNIIASQLRYFVIQEYIKPPLLLDTIHQGQKFHFRVYVVAFGAIKVYVWSEILALFAAESYTSPSVSCEDMAGHLTNTCLQDGSRKDERVMRFWSLPLPQEVLHQMFDQICQITGEVFLAAAAGQQMHFQTLSNAFEIFGVDFLVDNQYHLHLLEINSFPDFKQTGKRLTDHVVGGLFKDVTKSIICPFFGLNPDENQRWHDADREWQQGKLMLVKEVELRGKW